VCLLWNSNASSAPTVGFYCVYSGILVRLMRLQSDSSASSAPIVGF